MDPLKIEEMCKTFNLSCRTPEEVLLTFINWAIMIVGLLGIIAFIWAGFLYLTAGGDEGGIQKAKATVKYAVIGIIVSVIGLVVVNTIDKILKG